MPDVAHWRAQLRRLRARLNRREAAARLLGAAEPRDDHAPGVVLVQIDGLSRRQLERAIAAGRMSFLKRLLVRERYRLGTFYPGLPSTTPAVQAELFYGVRAAVPSFSYRSRDTGEVVDLLDPRAAGQVESAVAASGGTPLLAGGSAYCDIYNGGAAEPHFCVASLRYRDILARVRPWLWPGLSLLFLPTAARVLCLALAEAAVGVAEAAWGTFGGQRAKSEFEFVHNRVLVGVVAREWMVAGAGVDAARGLPVIHVNFLGYDEMAHRRGPDSAFAHRSLRGIDRAIRRIWRSAGTSRRREYELWVYSDHGQERTVQYAAMAGREIGDAVAEVAARVLPPGPPDRPRTSTVAIGPVGHVYPDPPADPHGRVRLAEALARESGVPVCCTIDAAGAVRFWTEDGRKGRLPEGAAELFGADHPHLTQLAGDMAALCRHRDAGQVVIGGWAAGRPPVSFAGENGGHAGPGPEETTGFTLVPVGVLLPHDTAVRPSEFRGAIQARLADRPSARACLREEDADEAGAVRVVTYNVHGCVGTDERLSPRRVARVLASCDPDVVALQELDVGRRRSGGRDQARDIADALGMACEFHASFEVAGERYGNAVLSRLPLRVVKAGPLPQRVPRPAEPRGALWVEVEAGGRRLQVLTTHLGLSADERLRQIEALLGPEWLGSSRRQGPCIVCGDLNSVPRSLVYRRLAGRMRDAARATGRARPTFPSRWPVLRIDHIFVSEGVEVVAVEAVRTAAAAVASDHLPLLAEIRVPWAATSERFESGVTARIASE